MSALNLRGLKSHDHETWHVGPLSYLDVHGPSEILIFGRVTPQVHAYCIFLFIIIDKRYHHIEFFCNAGGERATQMIGESSEAALGARDS